MSTSTICKMCSANTDWVTVTSRTEIPVMQFLGDRRIHVTMYSSSEQFLFVTNNHHGNARRVCARVWPTTCTQRVYSGVAPQHSARTPAGRRYAYVFCSRTCTPHDECTHAITLAHAHLLWLLLLCRPYTCTVAAVLLSTCKNMFLPHNMSVTDGSGDLHSGGLIKSLGGRRKAYWMQLCSVLIEVLGVPM
jgi:hypothetical protein